MDFQFDPAKIGLRVGLEIHQQLASSTKLFCACPVTKSEALPYSFDRRLRPAQSETGRLDPAAVFEFSKGRSNVYRWNPESSCLVEADEEPPHPLNEEAVEIVLLVSNILHSNILDEVHVMRKIVIDGSNTTGFQRTAVLALGGHLEVDGSVVGVQTVTLEEDAARILAEDAKARYFALDRLGVPLVEVALDPVTGTPEYVGEVALSLGRALRSTGRVARGLGTIRQDLNVSVMGGSVVEVKGVQKLNLIPKVVAYEASRQMGLIRLAEELRKKGVAEARVSSKEVSVVLKDTSCGVLQRALKARGKVVCVSAEGFAGLLGWEPFPGIRLGKELADVARANSLGGVIHSDEFANQGISAQEDDALRKELGCDKDAGLVILAGDHEIVDKTVGLIKQRLEQALDGVPAETRAPTDDGETRFMRPRPGAQRMYPETDIPDIVITSQRAEAVQRRLPEPWTSRVKRYEKEYSLSEDMALKVYDSDRAPLFERLSRQTRLEPSLVASLLVDVPARLAREGLEEEAIGDAILERVLRAVGDGRFAKEAATDVVRLLAKGEAKELEAALGLLGLTSMSSSDLEALVDRVIRSESKLIAERRDDAFSPLMGEVMNQVRGKVDGQEVSRLLRERLRAALKP